MMSRVLSLGATLVLLALPTSAAAQGGDAATNLSKASQNPVGDLISVPLQFNYFTGGGLDSSTLSILNLQPVVPLAIGKRWNIIARTIVPFVNAPLGGVRRGRGIGDIILQTFLTKQKPDDPIWGIGPVFSFPTATTVAARTSDWGLGPAAVIVKTVGPLVLGGLVTQLWTISSQDGNRHENILNDTTRRSAPDLNQFSIQPFINYNLADGWAIVFAPTFVANWELDDQWTVPLGLGVTKITAIGSQPMSLGIQYYANVVRPDASGHSQLRLVAAFLFPTAAHTGEKK